MKYDINAIFSTKNNLEVVINQTGSFAMIRKKGEEKATRRQGFRVLVDGETVGYGGWEQSEHELMCDVIKRERYAHLAYKEAYYDLLNKLSSIGFVRREEEEDDFY
jgi:hypothetical protein